MDNVNIMQSRQSNRWLKLLIITVFIGGLISFFVLGGNQYLSLDALKSNRDSLLDFTESNYVLMMAITIAVYTLSTALSVPGATILSLATGFLFGRWVGTGIILLSATIGATLVFLAARYLFADTARARMNSGMAAKLINGFHDNAFNYLLFLRLVPLFPFWLVNLAPAFTPITVRTYATATAIGILPGCFVIANLGQSLGRVDSLNQLISAETLLAFGLFGLFALVPVVIKKLKK